MGDARAWNVLSVASTWGANSTQEVGSILGVEGIVGVIEGKRLHWRVQKVGSPLPQPGMNPGRWTDSPSPA